MSSVSVKPAEREVALGEVQAVLAAARDETYRARLVAVADAVEHGELAAAEAADLERVLEPASRRAGSGRFTARGASRQRSGSSAGCPAVPS